MPTAALAREPAVVVARRRADHESGISLLAYVQVDGRLIVGLDRQARWY
jgi:hypothetical protein